MKEYQFFEAQTMSSRIKASIVSEYGCAEKYFSKPNRSVNYADIIQMHEPQQLGLVADVEVKYNE